MSDPIRYSPPLPSLPDKPVFDLFGAAKKSEVRVAYISTERGLVENVSICEANDYAKLNPGTQFIFRTREFTKYMNINGVNKLTPNDLEPQGFDDCVSDGINLEAECGPPKVNFSGGGGVGVKANPVIGADGSVMAIDLVSGGFGYKVAPQVEVKDNCGIGAGGFYTAELGEIVETVEVYDQEEDFEEYEICEPEDVQNWGRRWSVDGKDLGPWEPDIYMNLKKDPIRREIQQYQDFLLTKSKPWWTTRKEFPLSVTGESSTSRTKYDVDSPSWSEFMNKYAISPKPKSNASGSDFAGIPYSFVWEEDFPYDGEYVFRGARDNKAEFYLDGSFVSKLDPQNGGVNPIKKTLKAGVHQIRLDLLNIPVKEKIVVQQKIEEETQIAGVDFIKKAKGFYMIVGGNVDTEVSLQLKYNDNPNTAGTAITKITIPNPDGADIVLTREKDGTQWKKNGSVSGKGVFKRSEVGYGPIIFEGNVKDPQLEEKNTAYGPNTPKYRKIRFIDNHGDDTNARLSIVGSKNLQEKRIKVAGTTHKSTSTQELETHKVFNTVDFIDKANRPLWRTNVYGRGGFINEYGVCPFDTQNLLKDNPYAGTHTIVWNNVNFPIDGNYNINVMVDDNVKLTLLGKEGETVIDKKGFFGNTDRSTGKSTYLRSFKKGTYKIIADLYQKPGGAFGFKQDKKKRLKEVSFKVTSSAAYANKITIPGILSVGKEYKGAQIGENINQQIEIGKEYDVICQSAQKGTTFNSNKVKLRTRDGGTRLQMEDAGGKDWNDIECVVSNGEFYSINGNKCKFRVDETIKGINPMALAVDIQTVFTEKEIISPKSWNENPMGVSLTIDAPSPPIPQEPIVDQPGRCPKNPMWSTRYPGAEEKWWPVRFDGWSPFFNRYAMSPVAPSAEENTSGGGTVFTNTWNVEIPYGGWYKLKGEVDDICRVYFNGDLKLDLSRKNNNKIRGDKKFFLPKNDEGETTEIKVEVENYKFETFEFIDKKIFSTSDWAVRQNKTRQSGTVDVTFRTTSAAMYANAITIEGILAESKEYKGAQINSTITQKVEIGKVYNVTLTSAQSKRGVRLRAKDGSILQMEEAKDEDWRDVQCSASKGRFYDFVNGKNTATCKYIVEGDLIVKGGLGAGTAKDGVTYEGPKLATYRSGKLGPFLSPAYTDDKDFRQNFMGKSWTSVWKNIDFPEDGQYDIKCEADDIVIIKIDGVKVGEAKVGESVRTSKVNLTKGKRRVEMIFKNIPGNAKSTFATNPVVFNASITKKIKVGTGRTKSWIDNPIGVSLALIPPPCPKRIKGKGVVTRVYPVDPGNGYPRPGGDGYPVALELDEVTVDDPGINYDCTVDKIVIEPSNGAELGIECDNYGRIIRVPIITTGIFTTWPTIRIISDTGVRFAATPVFKVRRTPVDVELDKLVQVTDLVGLKQTGYYRGKPYYGAVFYKNGIRYAGWYETPGELVQIYSTLQESIDAEVTTPPSAILRQGSDVSSNDPRLNIPGTPENLI